MDDVLWECGMAHGWFVRLRKESGGCWCFLSSGGLFNRGGWLGGDWVCVLG